MKPFNKNVKLQLSGYDNIKLQLVHSSIHSFIHSFILIQAARSIKAHKQKIKSTTHNTRRQRNTKHSDKLHSKLSTVTTLYAQSTDASA